MTDWLDPRIWRDWWTQRTTATGDFHKIGGTEPARRFRQHYREAVQTVDPSMDDQTLEELVEYTLPFFTNSIVSTFENVTNTDVMNDRIADFIRINRKTIEASIKGYKQSTRAHAVIGSELDESAFHVNSRATLNNKLRSRYGLPNAATGQETWQRSLADTTQADLFEWNTTTQNGIYNSVHLDNRRHDAFIAEGAGMPRSSQNLEQLVGIRRIPSVWHDQQPVVQEALERMDTKLAEAMVTQGPPTSLALHDQDMTYDPFLRRSKPTFMVPQYAVQPYLKPDITYESDLKDMHEIGFRSSTATWRHPREPEDDFFLPLLKPADAIRSVNMDGFSIYQTF